MYAKTHGNIAAGVQRKRDYDWKTINPDTYVFGYGEQKSPNGAKKAVHSERLEEAFPKTVVVKKVVEDFNSVSHDQLGKSKNLGQGAKPF